MSHINSDTLEDYKSTHHYIHHLLKRYYNEQNITDEDLVEALEVIKDGCADMINSWKDYLGHD